jgi:two-component system, OmpR family, copper resistance phosphate regulon response regulator CusR
LTEQNLKVDVAYDGKTGGNLALANPYDVIITDIVMPEMNGIEMCRFLRNHGVRTPILMLSALDSTEEIVAGLEAGGDDYLSKPFEFRELLARVRAIGRRNVKLSDESNTLKIGNLVMNTHDKTVVREGIIIDLTPKEFKLFEFLVRRKGKVVTKVEIIQHVWDINFDTGTNVVEVYMNYLRKKIDKDFAHKLIQTRFGIGYLIQE